MTLQQGTDTLTLDHGVFTSIRSPMGVGYKLVGATAGITREEKQEITRAAPSHESMPVGATRGMLSFTLGTGRTCVMIARDAGAEQTGRGGSRIHTHILVLEPEQFAQVSFNPLRLEAPLLNTLGDEATTIPKTVRDRIEPITVPLENAVAPLEELLAEMPREPIAGALSDLLNQREVVVTDCPDDRDGLAAVLALVPAAFLRGRSLSYGLKYAPARRCDLMFAAVPAAEQVKLTQKYQVEIRDWNAPVELSDGDHGHWCRLVRGTAALDRVIRLAGDLADADQPDALAQCALMLQQLPLISIFSSNKLDDLQLEVGAGGSAPDWLREEWREAIKLRRAAIESDKKHNHR